MRKIRRHVLFIALLITVAALTLILSAGHPGYGSLTGGLPNGYTGQTHDTRANLYSRDLQREQQTPFRCSEEVSPLMENVLDSTAEVLSAASEEDYKRAGGGLEEVGSDIKDLNKQIARQNLIATGIYEFTQASQDNHRSLSGYLSDSEKLDRLQGREGDAAGLEGKAIRTRLNIEKNAIVKRSDRIIDVALQFGVNTTKFEESLEAFASPSDAAAPASSGNKTGPAPINLTVEPEDGVFGDTLLFSGELLAGTQADSVNITVDGNNVASVPTNGNRFRYEYLIDQGSPGVHSAYATAAGRSSGEVKFTIRPVDAHLTCDASYNPDAPGFAICSGMLITITGAPVTEAPVILSIDRERTIRVTTGSDGRYVHNGTFTAGRHTVTAYFTGDGLTPLNAAESRPADFVIPSLGSVLAPTFLLTSSIAITALSAAWFLQRSRHNTGYQGIRSFPDEEGQTAPQYDDESPEPHSVLPEPSADLLHEQTPHEAIGRIYSGLRDRIAVLHGPANAAAMTPREFAARHGRAQFGSDLETFVRRAEAFRYGGLVPTGNDLDDLAALAVAIHREAGGEED